MDAVTTEALCHNPEPSDDSPAEPLLFAPSPLSAAQLAANRSNAQLSCRPTSPEGRAKSSLNAVKSALTGRTVLLPSDDAPEYERHLRAYSEDFQPVGQRESDPPAALAENATGTFGDLGRNAVNDPGTLEFDASASRIFSITERWKLEPRAEGFNIINHTNFGNPTLRLNSSTFGRITSTRSAGPVNWARTESSSSP